MRARAFNPQVLLEVTCYSLFSILLFFLIQSGKYLDYVTPRMKPYLYFTCAVMLIWSCVTMFRVLRPQYKLRSTHCYVLAIPILLLVLPHSALTVSDITNGYVGGNNINSSEETVKPTSVVVFDSTVNNSETLPNYTEQENSLPGLDAVNKKITVSNDDFGMWINEIYMYMEKYEGYSIVLTGFVYIDPETIGEDVFVPARLMMSCCSADLAPLGLISHYDNMAELKKDSWITVEGTIFIGTYEYDGEKFDDPQIQVTKITPTEAVEGYVYSY